MKLISWNVNGLRACVKKGFEDFFKEADADIFCIQETKLQEGRLILHRKDMNITGIMQRKKVIQEQQSLQNSIR